MVVGSAKLERPLEEGGMGAVWVGHHTKSRFPVAVKFMLDEVARDEPTARERFEREARVLSLLDHDHVCKLFEEGRLDDGTPFIVMELISGESLVERLERTGEPFTLEQVTELVTQTCDALDHVHGRGIVHRDLKGENTYLVGKSDNVLVKIIDFGLATSAERTAKAKAEGSGVPSWGRKLTKPGEALGSPEYMSPEQILSSGDVDEHADLWAVAVLAYVALTLQFPFQSENLGQLLSTIMAAQYTPPSEVTPSVPAALDAWFARAFDLKKEKRFQSAREMADAWRRAVAGLDRQAATKASLVAVTPAAPKKSQTGLWVGLIIVLLLIGGGVAVFFTLL
jgi:serine/threonine protein kinase